MGGSAGCVEPGQEHECFGGRKGGSPLISPPLFRSLIGWLSPWGQMSQFSSPVARIRLGQAAHLTADPTGRRPESFPFDCRYALQLRG